MKHYYPDISCFLFIIPIIVGIKILVDKKMASDTFQNNIQRIIVGAFFCFVGLAGTLNGWMEYNLYYEGVYKEYKAGNCLECTGKVENLEADGIIADDCFEVDGVFFSVGRTQRPGYQKQSFFGGIIDEEGMNVELKYINYQDENFIVEVKVIEE